MGNHATNIRHLDHDQGLSFAVTSSHNLQLSLNILTLGHLQEWSRRLAENSGREQQEPSTNSQETCCIGKYEFDEMCPGVVVVLVMVYCWRDGVAPAIWVMGARCGTPRTRTEVVNHFFAYKRWVISTPRKASQRCGEDNTDGVIWIGCGYETQGV